MRTLLCIICSAWLCSLSYEAASAERLSSDEIVKLLKGTTIQTEDGKDRKYRITLKPDGTVKGERQGRNTTWDEGKWWTEKKGLFCIQWEFWKQGDKRCNFFRLQKDGKTLKRLKTDGAFRDNDWVIK